MPQKKNPDAAELLRAKAPRIVGAPRARFHGVMHALPLTYNKDLQEDKEHLFDAADTLELSLAAARGMLAAATFHRERMAARRLRRAHRRHRHRRPARPPAACPFRELARRRRRARAPGARLRPPLSRADRRGARRASASFAARRRFREVLEQRSWLESKVSEGGTSLGAAGRAARRGARGARRGRSAPSRRARPRSMKALPADFYARPVLEVAPELIGCTVEHQGCAGVIVETEAYHQSEPACHAYAGLTPRTEVLFGAPGRPTYTAPTASTRCSTSSASTKASAPPCSIRALSPLAGIGQMRVRRGLVGGRPARDRSSARARASSRRRSGSGSTRTAARWPAGPCASSSARATGASLRSPRACASA